MADALFEDPRWAQLYDPLDPDRSDLSAYVAVVDELRAATVLDVGCGTGTLACLLARRGITVIGVDPAGASLDIARAKPGAERVRWIHGDATALPALGVDLAVMTGNVAQVFLTDEQWMSALRSIARAMRRDGWLVLETRVPARRAWERWTREQTWARTPVDGVGAVESWEELEDVAGALITFRSFARWDDVVLESRSTLRFRDRAEVEASLHAAGFEVHAVRDAPDRPGLEHVFLARSRRSEDPDRDLEVRAMSPAARSGRQDLRRGRDEAADAPPSAAGGPVTDLLDELDAWLDAHWDPALTVAAWWELLGRSGWAAPALPPGAFGRGVGDAEVAAIAVRLAERGVLGPPGGAGLTIVAPTIAAHGSPEQIETLLAPIVTGRQAWCLLFSEPAAGSDLAALTTTARLDGEEWSLEGAKTWATGAHLADMAVVLARSDPSSTRHRGLSLIALDLHQPGAVEVRPMREMTGRALSNDVVLAGARAPSANVIGAVGDGWVVVNSALTAERRSAAGHRAPAAAAGSIAGDLDRTVTEVLERAAARRRSAAAGDASDPPPATVRVAAGRSPTAGRPATRQALARLHSCVEVARLTAARADDERRAGRELAGAANIAKLWAGEIARQSRDLGAELLGARALLHAYDGDGRRALEDADGGPVAARVTAMMLAAQGVSLAGGVDRLQRDLLGERVLGLPKSPAPPTVSDGAPSS